MDKKLLEDYARLIVDTGARITKGEEVVINCNLDQPEFITMVVEKCYKAGAKRVMVNWNHNPIEKLDLKYQTLGTLSNLTPMALAKQKFYTKKLCTMLHIISDDPDALKGVNQTKYAKSRAKLFPKIKKYRDARDGKYKWVIAAVPSKPWAKKVFPKLNEDDAVEALWKAILTTSRVDGNDPVENWNKHNEILTEKKEKLSNLNLKCLKYKASNGTDFSVELIPGVVWGAGQEVAVNKGLYNPNIPSEEVFTTPYRGKCEGLLVASKPLSYNGELIEDFSIRFENGKAVQVKARKGQKILEHLIKMDEGAAMLGEVALVPFDSPINNSGILFYETLFDENAACHVALGFGFRELYPDSDDMTTEQLKEKGINDSMVHVDFMIGTKDLSIVGETFDGKKVQIFKDGNWAI